MNDDEYLNKALTLAKEGVIELRSDKYSDGEPVVRVPENDPDHPEACARVLRSALNRLRSATEKEIVAAYQRGARWMRENPASPEYVAKAALDYADVRLESLKLMPSPQETEGK